jgi:hypothetical protein
MEIVREGLVRDVALSTSGICGIGDFQDILSRSRGQAACAREHVGWQSAPCRSDSSAW